MGWMSTSDYNEARDAEFPDCETHAPIVEVNDERRRELEKEGLDKVIEFIRKFGKENKIIMDLCSLSNVNGFACTFRKDLAHGCAVYGKWRPNEYGRSECSVTRYIIYIDGLPKRRKWSLKLLN